jgi:general transcription factor IIIA
VIKVFFLDCGFCSKNFKTQEALRTHTKVHTEPAKLSCSYPSCKEIFQDRRSLKEHESSHIDDTSMEYVCKEQDCGKVYTSPKALRNHKKMKHNEDETDEISCDICKTSFRKDQLAEHLRIHI